MSIGYMNPGMKIGQIDADPAAAALTAVATILSVTMPFAGECYAVMCAITTQPTVTAPVISVRQTVLGGAAVVKGTTTIPTTAAVGSVWYNDQFAPFQFNIGDIVDLRVTTAATAGAGRVWFMVRRSAQKKPTITAALYNEVAS